MINPNFYPPQYANAEQAKQQYQMERYFRHKRQTQKHQLIGTGIVIGGTLILGLILQIIIIQILYLSPYYSVYSNSSLFQNAFNIIVVDVCSLFIPFSIMSFILKKQYEGELIPRKSIPKLTAFAWICFGMGCCIGANYIASYVIELFKQFGYKLTQTEYKDPSSVFECVVLVFSTAIAPALFEEFAMRCCTLGALRKFGKGFAVFSVSIVFGLIHQNVIQFVFAFFVGLTLAYITVVTDSIVPAILIHALNNSMSVVKDILNYAGLSKISNFFSSSIFIFWAALALFGIAYLLYKKQLIPKSQMRIKEPYELSFAAKLLCLLPGLLLPFIIMIWITTKTVIPIS